MIFDPSIPDIDPNQFKKKKKKIGLNPFMPLTLIAN